MRRLKTTGVFILVGILFWAMYSSRESLFEMDFEELYVQHRIPEAIGITISQFKKEWVHQRYAIHQGKKYEVGTLPVPPGPSQQHSITAKNRYDFLPDHAEYRIAGGPQLLSPDGTTLIASSISTSSPPRRAYTFMLIDVKTGKILKLQQMDETSEIEGIAWSPDSHYFAILTATPKVRFNMNIFRSIAGHPTKPKSFSLSIFKKNGDYLFTDRIIALLNSGEVEIVWTKMDLNPPPG